MDSPASSRRGSRIAFWTGWVLTIILSLFLLMDGVMKLVKPRFVVDATVQLGYAENTIIPIGVVLLVCVALYLIPATAVLGAILLTAYLGGAVATQVRAEQVWFNILFPVFFGILLWVALILRDARLRALVPLRS